MSKPYIKYDHKPFPARVRWGNVWKHRWVILDFLNQVAHGNWKEAEQAAHLYGGSTEFGYELKRAANDIIEVDKEFP